MWEDRYASTSRAKGHKMRRLPKLQQEAHWGQPRVEQRRQRLPNLEDEAQGLQNENAEELSRDQSCTSIHLQDGSKRSRTVSDSGTGNQSITETCFTRSKSRWASAGGCGDPMPGGNGHGPAAGCPVFQRYGLRGGSLATAVPLLLAHRRPPAASGPVLSQPERCLAPAYHARCCLRSPFRQLASLDTVRLAPPHRYSAKFDISILCRCRPIRPVRDHSLLRRWHLTCKELTLPTHYDFFFSFSSASASPSAPTT